MKENKLSDIPVIIPEDMTIRDLLVQTGSYDDMGRYRLPFAFLVTSDKILARFERTFTLEEMKACALAMINYGEGHKGALTPDEFFETHFRIDLSKT